MIVHQSILNALCKEPSEETQTLIINYVKEQVMKDKLLELYHKAHIDVLNGELAYQIEALEEVLKNDKGNEVLS